jgi:hypothetical protein
MESPHPKREDVAVLARKAAGLLEAVVPTLDRQLTSPLPVNALFQDIAFHDAARASSWDETTSAYLALAALHRARTDLRIAVPAAELKRSLPNVNRWSHSSLKAFEPDAINKRLMQFKNQVSKEP